MPIYEYRCSDCEQIFEEWLKTFDEAPRSCPVCGGRADRIVSNTSFVLKGGGWYVTDYGNRSSTDSHAGASAEAATGDAGSNGKGGSDASSATAAPASAEGPAKCTAAAPSGGCAAATATGS